MSVSLGPLRASAALRVCLVLPVATSYVASLRQCSGSNGLVCGALAGYLNVGLDFAANAEARVCVRRELRLLVLPYVQLVHSHPILQLQPRVTCAA